MQALAPEHIAVLTRTHRQAQMIKEALSRRGVPAVLYSAGSVFETREAAELMLVMQAIAAPSDPFKVRTALAGDLLGAEAQELCTSVEAPGDEWIERWAGFEAYHHIWLRYGFYRMFGRFMEHEKVPSRLLSLPEGERRLTNLLHLAELLHQASVAHRWGPEELLKWMAVQCKSGGSGEDTEKLRLESDAHAVRIVTIHKSKGLQFDVVFCPFTWAGAKVDDKVMAFHDPEARQRLTLAIGPDIAPEHKALALAEALSENLRLLYVALTRARQRCYMVWGCIKGTAVSAPAYLLHSPPAEKGQTRLDRPAATKNGRAGRGLAAGRAPGPGRPFAGDHWRNAFAGGHRTHVSRPCRPAKRFALPAVHPRIDAGWRIASYSAISAGAAQITQEAADRDAAPHILLDSADSAMETDALFEFPKGVRAGLFFHDLLENWDFSDSENENCEKLIEGKLDAYGFEARWVTAVHTMLKRLGTLKLPVRSSIAGFCLSDIQPQHRVNEMEFYFPLKRLTAEQLREVFRQHGTLSEAHLLTPQLERISFAPMEGFLKGYMDMVFDQAGRFYLVDWKSNYLGSHWGDYASQQLARVMAEDFYFLQYHLYVVALDQLLRRKIPDYRYDLHFGGVYYFFLRGVQDSDPSTGIYHAVPDIGIVQALNTLLLDG